MGRDATGEKSFYFGKETRDVHITMQAFHTHKTPISCRFNSAGPMTQATAVLVPELYITASLSRAGSSCSDVAGLQKVTAKLARSCNLVILRQYEPELCHLLPHTASSLLPCNLIHCQSSSVTMTFAVSVWFWVCTWSSDKMEAQTGLSYLDPLHLNSSPEQYLWHQEEKTAGGTLTGGTSCFCTSVYHWGLGKSWLITLWDTHWGCWL